MKANKKRFIILAPLFFIKSIFPEMIYEIEPFLPNELQQKTPIQTKNKIEKQLFVELQFIEIAKNQLKKLSLPIPFLNNSIPFIFHIDGSFKINPIELQSSLNSLLQNGHATLLASPQILTKENSKSTIIIGDKIPYLNTTYNGQTHTTSLKMIETGITLTTTAFINATNKIETEIKATFSSVKLFKEYETGSYPILSTRQLDTLINISPNEITLVGAIYQKSERNNENKSSLFHSIPYLKNLKTLSQTENEETSILIFMKVNIIE
jgi:type II secretory pathway component GspD/PulD (secretin)